ncbi:DUF551 domain-containing protein [Pseudomonas nicosulfuronedens]
MSEWISVQDRLPEPETDVMVWLKKCSSKQGVATAGMFYDIGADELTWMGWEMEEPFRTSYEVTHWKPLPAPPAI